MALIEVKGLSKTFRIPSVKRETVREHFFGAFSRTTYEQLKVLDQISFEVEEGETLGIMGRNGSGKSTLLKILAQIYCPDEGSVTVRAALTPILELGAGWNRISSTANFAGSRSPIRPRRLCSVKLV